MKILGIGWVGTRTDRVAEMAEFCSNVLGLKARPHVPGVEAFDLPNGDIVEVVGPDIDMGELKNWCTPKADFLVEDVAAARAEMESHGVEFIGPVESSEAEGVAWTHFRAPDGHVYGLTSNRSHPLSKQPEGQS